MTKLNDPGPDGNSSDMNWGEDPLGADAKNLSSQN